MVFIEASVAGSMATVLTVALLVGLVAFAILATCPKFQHKTALAADGAAGYPSNSGVFGKKGGTMRPPGALGTGFQGVSEDGFINEREAPETLKNRGNEFNPQSVNFSNIQDFRGDAIAMSTRIQDERAKSVLPGTFKKLVPLERESEEESVYDSESDFSSDEEDVDPKRADAMPSVLASDVGTVRPPSAPNTNSVSSGTFKPKNDLDRDLEAGIQMHNPQMAAMQGQSGSGDILKSLNFSKEAVQASFAEQEKSRKKRKKKRVKKRVKKGVSNGGNGSGTLVPVQVNQMNL